MGCFALTVDKYTVLAENYYGFSDKLTLFWAVEYDSLTPSGK